MFNLGPLYKNHSGLCGKLGDPYQTEGEQESTAVNRVATSHLTTTGQQHHSNDGQCVSVAVCGISIVNFNPKSSSFSAQAGVSVCGQAGTKNMKIQLLCVMDSSLCVKWQ